MRNTRTEVRSPTRTEVRSPTRTSTRANTRGNFTSTVTGGAGAGETKVTINIPGQTPHDTGSLLEYPIAMSDTGALPESVEKVADLAIAQPLITGAVLGLLIGHFVYKSAIPGAIIGAIGGKFALPGAMRLIQGQ